MLNTTLPSAISLHREAAALDGEAMRLRAAGDRLGAQTANIKARVFRDLAEQVEQGGSVADQADFLRAAGYEVSERGQPLVYKRESIGQHLLTAFCLICVIGGLIMWAGANVYPVAGQ